jgi:hypothetical protein
MTTKRITRRASDNRYLHRDFHGALSNAIDYLHQNYGSEAVREYLRQFTRRFYAPLKRRLQEEGLTAVRGHYERVYGLEGGDIRSSLGDGELVIEVEASPAVMHMRKQDYAVAELFHETIRTVNEALCEETPFVSELRDYDPQTGACTMVFRRTER